jgi:phasin family protein
MFTVPEQFSGIARANLESQLAVFTTLTSKAFESMEKVVDLNLNAAKASLEDSANVVQQILSAKDVQEALALTAAQTQPTAAKALAYSRQLAGIATSAQSEFVRAAEEQFTEASRRVSELVDDVSRNAPAGSENVIAIVKSAIGNANAGYEQFSKSTKQAAEVMEANMNSAVTQFAQVAEKAATRGRGK